MKIIRILNSITVVLNNGEIISSDNCTDAIFNTIYNNQQDEELIKSLLLPEFSNKKQDAQLKKALFDEVTTSSYLTTKGKSVYILGISQLSLPEDLVTAILKAEKENNKELLDTYFNFWTLVSLNPDSRCRQNLFWFLNKYGMTISKSGLFVAYRNVNIKQEGSDISAELANFVSSKYSHVKFVTKKSPKNYYVVSKNSIYTITTAPENDVNVIGNLSDLYKELSNVEVSTVYTDGYTGRFEIKLGEIVSIPRENCDSVQEHTCSRGLHVAGRSWLQANYFGKVGLMVLVNPADVVAVPPEDSYGKMRTCAYYPVSVVEFDSDGTIVPLPIEDGFEDDFIDKICFQGTVNNDDSNPYHIVIPEIPEIDKSLINSRLLKLAKSRKKKLVQ